jgi:hypothetical protein
MAASENGIDAVPVSGKRCSETTMHMAVVYRHQERKNS